MRKFEQTLFGNIFSRKLKKVYPSLIEGTFLTKLIKNVLIFPDRLLGFLCRIILMKSTPVQNNKVLFFTQENRYICNPKYICEELLRRKSKCEIVWAVGKGKSEVPYGIKKVRFKSLNYYKELFSAKVIITNGVLYKEQPVRLHQQQVLIETWHGSLGIKKFGPKEYKDSWLYILGAKATGKRTNYCITNSSFVSQSLANAYWPKTKMLEFGHPRNDILFDNQLCLQLKKDFCLKYEISPDTKFVMYGPTFRDNKSINAYDLNLNKLLDALEKRFGGHWVGLMRYHRVVKSAMSIAAELDETLENRVIDVTGIFDMQKLIAITDIAITDYSSWIYDFMLRRLPGFIYASDIEIYNNERGFCYPLESTPFPIASNNRELIENIMCFDNEKYLKDLENFLIDKGCIEDGNASKRSVDKILEIVQC